MMSEYELPECIANEIEQRRSERQREQAGIFLRAVTSIEQRCRKAREFTNAALAATGDDSDAKFMYAKSCLNVTELKELLRDTNAKAPACRQGQTRETRY